MYTPRYWDIFCTVIDNYGDIGVCWRLASQLAQRGERVRLWVDDPSALRWMAPQGQVGVTVHTWTRPLDTARLADLTAGTVLIEAFGCEIPPEFLQLYQTWRRQSAHRGAWINLEYLSAESYVERSHGLPSPVMHGAGAGLTKHFYYPGFTERTGGLLREPDLLVRQQAFNAPNWLLARGLGCVPQVRTCGLFCYETPALAPWLLTLAHDLRPTQLLVAAGRTTDAVRAAVQGLSGQNTRWNAPARLAIHYLPHMPQAEFDHLLWACDFNVVRGEDSLVRALWSARPFVWHIYPQQDDAHHAKLQAFLDWVQAPPSLRQAHAAWNHTNAQAMPDLNALEAWQTTAEVARTRLLSQHDLVSQLLEFVARVAT